MPRLHESENWSEFGLRVACTAPLLLILGLFIYGVGYLFLQIMAFFVAGAM